MVQKTVYNLDLLCRKLIINCVRVQVNGGDRVIPWDYDVSDFHEYYVERQAKEQAKNQVKESVAQVETVKKE
jgi:hypothetical protein